ncbi:MAG: carbohydrate kinase family protein [Thermoplasmata archaeon]
MVGTLDCTAVGDAMIDIVVRFPSKGEAKRIFDDDVTNASFSVAPGGTANVATGLADLGGKSAFVGKIGKDLFGDLFRRDLQARGVMDNLSVSREHNTGLVLDLVLGDGERHFLVDRGANADLDIRDVNVDLIQKSRFVYFVGYSFQDPLTSLTVRDAIDLAHREKKVICFSPGSPYLAKEHRDLFAEIIKEYVKILFLNEEEAMFLTRCEDAEKSVSLLKSLGPETIVLTRGAEGSIAFSGEDTCKARSLPAKCIDSTGAGDAFAAAFLYAKSREWDIERSVTFANGYAGRIVRRVGARL